ncbi:hypothetical protein LINPERPRIM_LOCUS17516, partial [Linum perenne]
MARLSRSGRSKVLAAVVCMWTSIIHQYVGLLMEVYVVLLRLSNETNEHR